VRSELSALTVRSWDTGRLGMEYIRAPWGGKAFGLGEYTGAFGVVLLLGKGCIALTFSSLTYFESKGNAWRNSHPVPDTSLESTWSTAVATLLAVPTPGSYKTILGHVTVAWNSLEESYIPTVLHTCPDCHLASGRQNTMDIYSATSAAALAPSWVQERTHISFPYHLQRMSFVGNRR